MQQQNYFQLFGLSPGFFIDADKLADSYRRLQRQFHPDRFASAPAQEKCIALQYATHINEAYQCLKSPLLRAAYLLELAGCIQHDHTMRADAQFLLQQMEWREQLASAPAAEQLQALAQQAASAFADCQQQFADAYEAENYSEARHIVDKMHFVSKFGQELHERLANLAEN